MSHETDSPIRVVVTPSQSSCFAGEMMSITITFTNTKTSPENSSQAVTRTHKRGAHSISTVPLAQPPTSPRSPRMVLPAVVPRKLGENGVIERKGLIGRSDSHSRKMRNSNRSLSLDMTFKGNCEVSSEQETSPPPPKTPIHVQRALGTTTGTPHTAVVFGNRRLIHHPRSLISTHLITSGKICIASYLIQTPSCSQTISARRSNTVPTGHICPHYPIQPVILPLARSHIRKLTWVRSTHFAPTFLTSDYWYGAYFWSSETSGRHGG